MALVTCCSTFWRGVTRESGDRLVPLLRALQIRHFPGLLTHLMGVCRGYIAHAAHSSQAEPVSRLPWVTRRCQLSCTLVHWFSGEHPMHPTCGCFCRRQRRHARIGWDGELEVAQQAAGHGRPKASAHIVTWHSTVSGAALRAGRACGLGLGLCTSRPLIQPSYARGAWRTSNLIYIPGCHCSRTVRLRVAAGRHDAPAEWPHSPHTCSSKHLV